MTERVNRFYSVELRAELTEPAEGTPNEYRLKGHPIVFNTLTDLGPFSERISPDALTDADFRDVRLLVNHDTNQLPLARSRNNNENSTMRFIVREEDVETDISLDVEHNPRAAELYSAVKRGDVSGMSFAFTVEEDAWEALDSDHPVRTIRKIGKIFEVSAVTAPAYPTTSIEAADARAALESARAALESAKADARKADMVAEIRDLLRGGRAV